jgi:DNA primase large subunit
LNSNVVGGKIIEKKELEVQKIFTHSFDSWRNKVSCINLVDVAFLLFFSPVIIFLIYILDINKLVFNYYIFEIKLLNDLKLENKNKLFSFIISYWEISQKLNYPLTSSVLVDSTYLKKYDSSIFLFNRSNKENWENFLFFKKLNLKNNYIL